MDKFFGIWDDTFYTFNVFFFISYYNGITFISFFKYNVFLFLMRALREFSSSGKTLFTNFQLSLKSWNDDNAISFNLVLKWSFSSVALGTSIWQFKFCHKVRTICLLSCNSKTKSFRSTFQFAVTTLYFIWKLKFSDKS